MSTEPPVRSAARATRGSSRSDHGRSAAAPTRTLPLPDRLVGARIVGADAKAIVPSHPRLGLGADDDDDASSSIDALPAATSARTRERRVRSASSAHNHAHVAMRRFLPMWAHARNFAAARHVLGAQEKPSSTPRAPVIVGRSDSMPCATASFVENFALAEGRVSSGIKHGTVRNVSTPRVRAASIQPFTRDTGRQELSSRVIPSRLVVLSPLSSTARPPRSDRFSVGCRPSEDQGGPP